ncbi:MAG: hypothetical protein Q9191_001079 [Dirinaria sp. TL-2023a]
MRISSTTLFLWTALVALVASWTPADHEIFRLRDEIAATEGPETTFYDFLGVRSSASQEDISKSYRKKSRLIHPDKAKQSFIASRAQKASKPQSGQKKRKPGVHVAKPPSESEIQAHVKKASERFARLGVIANILKGPGRERYDFFLANGFPKWRGTGYYYARFRPGLGSVLLGLFVLGGGGAHYAALYLSWKRQREFVERYIKHARRAAWGDEVGIPGIPGIDAASAPAAAATAQEDSSGMTLNRRQKRMQEKENKKESKKGKSGTKPSGTSTPLEQTEVQSIGPQGAKKRVQAENGKVLIVDSVGNVYLEEQDADGNLGEFLLDPDEIARPTWRQTVLVRLPVWGYRKAKERIYGARLGGEEKLMEGEEEYINIPQPKESEAADAKLESNGSAHKNGKRKGKPL